MSAFAQNNHTKIQRKAFSIRSQSCLIFLASNLVMLFFPEPLISSSVCISDVSISSPHTSTNYKSICNRSSAQKLKEQYKFSPIAYVLFDLMQKTVYSSNSFDYHFKDGVSTITELVPVAKSLNIIVHSAGNTAGLVRVVMTDSWWQENIMTYEENFIYWVFSCERILYLWTYIFKIVFEV